MKLSVIITTILAAQVSASLFDVFHGAVVSVQNSFGKFFSDVVTDVTVTVDCTILAVEHVLSLSQDATTRYNEKCGSVSNKTDSVSDAQHDKSLPNVEFSLNISNNKEYLEKEIPTKIDAKTNETVSKVFGNNTTNGNELSVENVLAKELEQVAGVSDVVKKEMEKLSNEVTTDLKNIEKQRDSEPSVDTILQEIMVLEEKEENTNNTSEAYEIHQIIDKVLGKLDAIQATEVIENIKLEEILKILKKYSDNPLVKFEEWKKEESRYLGDIKDHKEISDHLRLNNKDQSNDTQPVISKTDLNRYGVESTLDSQELSDVNTTQVKNILDSSTNPRATGESDYQSSISVGKGPSTFQNNTLEEIELNDTMITSTSLSTTESPTALESSELSTLSTNQSITPQSNFTADDTNETMANTTVSITDGGPINETIQPVDNTKESTSVTTNKLTTILSTNENNSTETVIISNPLPATNISLDNISQLVTVENNTDSRIGEDFGTNNDTVTTSAARVETELISIAQGSVINHNANDTAITSISNTMLENTTVNATDSENLETSTLSKNEFVTTLAPFEDTQSNDTIITRWSSCKNDSMPVSETGPPIDTSAFTVNEESSTVPTKIVGDNDSNTSSIENTPVNETILTVETTLASGKEESLTGIIKIVDDNNSNDTMKESSSLPIIESTTLGETILETSPTLDDEETKIILINDDYSNINTSATTIFTSDSSPIVETAPVSKTIEPEKTTTSSGNENSLNESNDTMIKSPSLSIAKSTPSSETNHAEAITSFEPIKETTMESLNNLKDSSDYIINITATPLITNYEIEIIEAINTSTDFIGEEEHLGSAINNPTGTSNVTDDTNVTALPISESICEENITAAENEETLLLATNSTTISTTPLIDTDSNTDIITSTLFPPSEITTVTEVVKPVESNTSLENEEPIILSINSPETVENEEVTNDDIDLYDDIDSYDEVTNTTTLPNADSEPATETIETIAASEEQMSLTSTLNDTVTTSTALTECKLLTETITPVESPTATRNEEDLPSLITDTFSSSTPKKETKQLLTNSEVPDEILLYSQTFMPPITSGLSNDDPELFTSDTLVDNDPNQQTKLENEALERLLHSELPFAPDEDILKILSTPLVTIAPKLNFEYPLNMPIPARQPYSFDATSATTDESPLEVLTTHTLTKTADPAKNDETRAVDYDSFFQTPAKDSEVHQLAVKEARQLISNSKRSARNINRIMKHKNKYNARING